MQRIARGRPGSWLALVLTALTSGAAKTPDSVTAAKIADVIDADNFGDGRDILITIQRPADAAGTREYRILVARATSPGLTVPDAVAMDADRYTVIPVDGTGTEYRLAAGALDTDGTPIVEAVAYRVYLLELPVSGNTGASALTAAGREITLRRTDLVKTITGVIEAGSGGMDIDAQGRIYHADFGATLTGPPGTRVHRISPDGSVSVWAEGLIGASGNAFDSHGNLFQSNIGGRSISRITPDGQVSSFATDGIFGPVGIAIDAADNLYVANCGNNTIRKVRPDGSTLPFAESKLLACPNGITLAPDGNLYVANFGNGDVLRVTPDGVVTRFVTIEGNNNGHILFGNGVLYVVARAANRLYSVSLDGETTLLAGSGERGSRDGAAADAMLSLPNDLALSNDGTTLYFNDVAGLNPDPSVISPVVVRALIMAPRSQN